MQPLTPEQVDGVIRDLVQSFFGCARAAGMSYRDLEPLVGVTYQTLNNWDRGKTPGDLHSLLVLMWAKGQLESLSAEEATDMNNNQAKRRKWVASITKTAA
jgi:hypothetical protein